MSYHKLPINKHAVGSPHKIHEEFLEYLDAVATGNKIMAVQELSDLYGCIETEIQKYDMSVEDLKVMSDLTKEVFSKGARISQDFISLLKKEADSILSWGLGFIQVKCGDINYNFYHKDVEKFESTKYPHSHQRDFVSEIIKGEVREVVYSVKEGKNTAYCACGNLFADKLKLDYEISDSLVHSSGDLYLRQKEEYHSVTALHGTVTKVVKYGNSHNAFVIAPTEVKMIKHIPEVVCWRMVQECLDV